MVFYPAFPPAGISFFWGKVGFLASDRSVHCWARFSRLPRNGDDPIKLSGLAPVPPGKQFLAFWGNPRPSTSPGERLEILGPLVPSPYKPAQPFSSYRDLHQSGD